MLRLLDARASSRIEVRPARAGLLRVCAYVPAAAGKTDITGLRVLLVADVLARAAETRDLQALTAFVFAGQVSRPVQGDGDEPAGERFAKWSWTPGPPGVQLKVADSV